MSVPKALSRPAVYIGRVASCYLDALTPRSMFGSNRKRHTVRTHWTNIMNAPVEEPDLFTTTVLCFVLGVPGQPS